MVALPVSYSMKKRLCDAGCSSIASGCSRRASSSDPTRVNSSKGRSRYSPSTHRNSRGTFAHDLPSWATRPRKISFAITSCFKNACPTSCFGTLSNFSPSRCDPISNPSGVNAQTAVHPFALPYPRSPLTTAACPPISAANCLSLVDDLALLLPENINLSICSLVRYRQTAKSPHNSLSLSVSCRFRPALPCTSTAASIIPPHLHQFPATQSSRWEWVAGKGRRCPHGALAGRTASVQHVEFAGRNRQLPRNSPRALPDRSD